MTDKARILFVDDEKRVLNAMRGLFRRKYDLFLTCEGAEAVRLVEENNVDVIVADQRMPGMTGIQVLEAVKKRSPRTVRILADRIRGPDGRRGLDQPGRGISFPEQALSTESAARDPEPRDRGVAHETRRSADRGPRRIPLPGAGPAEPPFLCKGLRAGRTPCHEARAIANASRDATGAVERPPEPETRNSR